MNQREIKFRAWDKEEKEMLEDVCTNTDDFTDMLNETFKYWQDQDFEPRLILMQYTGLSDKNGKEIWEGDIVRYKGTNNEIKWNKDQWVIGSWTPGGLYDLVDRL